MSSHDRADFGVLLNIAFHSFKQALEADLAASGYDDVGPSFGYVFRLLAERPHTLSDLARRLQITLPGALKLVDDMVAKGYVVRMSDEADRRLKHLNLTPRGRAALERARRFHARYEKALVDRLGASKVAACRRVLEFLAGPENTAQTALPRPA